MSLKIFQQLRYLNSKAATITKPHRLTYARLYPTVLVRIDGSTINIRYHEPRGIIKLPPREDELTEAERKARDERRKPKKKIVIEDDIQDQFDSNKYLKYLNKR